MLLRFVSNNTIKYNLQWSSPLVSWLEKPPRGRHSSLMPRSPDPLLPNLSQVPVGFWLALTITIGATEQKRATVEWVKPKNVPFDQPSLLLEGYLPREIGFDPLGFKPEDPEESRLMQTRGLQNSRLAMIVAAGFMAQELVDGKGILQHFT